MADWECDNYAEQANCPCCSNGIAESERLRAELGARDEADFYTYRYKAAIANENTMFRVRDELCAKIAAQKPVVDAARALDQWYGPPDVYYPEPTIRAIRDAVRALDERNGQ